MERTNMKMNQTYEEITQEVKAVNNSKKLVVENKLTRRGNMDASNKQSSFLFKGPKIRQNPGLNERFKANSLVQKLFIPQTQPKNCSTINKNEKTKQHLCSFKSTEGPSLFESNKFSNEATQTEKDIVNFKIPLSGDKFVASQNFFESLLKRNKSIKVNNCRILVSASNQATNKNNTDSFIPPIVATLDMCSDTENLISDIPPSNRRSLEEPNNSHSLVSTLLTHSSIDENNVIPPIDLSNKVFESYPLEYSPYPSTGAFSGNTIDYTKFLVSSISTERFKKSFDHDTKDRYRTSFTKNQNLYTLKTQKAMSSFSKADIKASADKEIDNDSIENNMLCNIESTTEPFTKSNIIEKFNFASFLYPVKDTRAYSSIQEKLRKGKFLQEASNAADTFNIASVPPKETIESIFNNTSFRNSTSNLNKNFGPKSLKVRPIQNGLLSRYRKTVTIYNNDLESINKPTKAHTNKPLIEGIKRCKLIKSIFWPLSKLHLPNHGTIIFGILSSNTVSRTTNINSLVLLDEFRWQLLDYSIPEQDSTNTLGYPLSITYRNDFIIGPNCIKFITPLYINHLPKIV